MKVHRSNRTEELIAVLANVLQEHPPDPLQAETIVVQGPGMERWLSMQLAERFGVWAHPRFVFPRKALTTIFDEVLGAEAGAVRFFDPECLMWAIADLLPRFESERVFAPIARYLEDDHGGRKRIQLAGRIANTFSDYITFRPEMIRAWEAGREVAEGSAFEQAWQPMLWRALVERAGTPHFAERARRFIEACDSSSESRVKPSGRLSVFGVSSLPPLFLQLFERIGRRIDVHLFVLSPSREYWADLTTRRRAHREEFVAESSGDLHFEEGHPLLASMGHLGADFQRLLEDCEYEEVEGDLFRESCTGAGTRLERLQDDMLTLRSNDATGSLRKVEADDPSIRIHSCHSPLREVEVLREELLACFAEIPGLEPRDVIVMTPDIEAYVPFIEAVFDAPSRDPARGEETRDGIPHHIADRGPSATDEVAAALRRALALLSGRFGAEEGLDLLGLAPVRSRFEIGGEDLETLHGWVRESGIRWAVDAAHRASFTQPECAENTWRFGLDRMLLGVALPDGETSLYRGVRPLPGIEGREAEVLGRFVEFCEFLFGMREAIDAPHPPEAWRDLLGELITGLIHDSDETHHQILRLRGVLDEIAESARLGGFTAPISQASMREEIERGLRRASSPRGFLSGGVTFCEFVPMRSIPFRVVCLLGMNDETFPRVRPTIGFDLRARNSRTGDRSAREDDRYLFLEALLSARERLLLSYVGQSIHDGSMLPPSVVVSELLDALAASSAVESGLREMEEDPRKAIRERLVIEHPLQPFSSRYFDGEAPTRLFSYSAIHLQAARRLQAPRESRAPFITEPLAERPTEGIESDDVLELDDLLRFYQHPARHFLRTRLGVGFHEGREAVSAREPFEVEGLDRWSIESELLERSLAGEKREEMFATLRATGRLPVGMLGVLVFDDLVREVAKLTGPAAELRAGGERFPLEIKVEIEGRRIVGRLDDLYDAGLVRCSFSKTRGPGRLDLWIRHLVLQSTIGGNDPAARSTLIGLPANAKDSPVVTYEPVSKLRVLLAVLVRFYRVGQSSPLPLFRNASWAYAEALSAKMSPEEALARARTAYTSARAGDGDDAWNDLAFSAEELFSPSSTRASASLFVDAAREVVLPIVEQLRNGSGDRR